MLPLRLFRAAYPPAAFYTTDGFAGPSPFLSPSGIPPGDKNLKKGQLKGIAPGMGSRYNRMCISADRNKTTNWNLTHRQNESFRTSPQTGVGISIEFQIIRRHTDGSILPFSGIHPRKVVLLTGGLPRQCVHWLAMTGNSPNSNLPRC